VGPFDRVLLAVYTFFLTAVFVLFSAVVLGWTMPVFLLKDLFYPGRPEYFWPLMLLIVLAGLRLFWVSLFKPKGRHVILAESALGQIRVSLVAIESLVEKVVSQLKGVREVKPRIVPVPQGVGMQVRVSVTPDVKVPELSVEIQTLVKDKILEVTGLTVKNIRISVENISASRPRVE